jgi:GAF domain-containing protein
LLETLAAQVAVSIRNVRLLESTSRQAERERLLYEITRKIRNSPDMQTIIQTTATELQKALNTRCTRIEIDVDTALQLSNTESQPLEPDGN